jgi:hypothetical protein
MLQVKIVSSSNNEHIDILLGTNPRLGMKNAPMQMPIIIKILKNQNLSDMWENILSTDVIGRKKCSFIFTHFEFHYEDLSIV